MVSNPKGDEQDDRSKEHVIDVGSRVTPVSRSVEPLCSS